MNRVKTVAPVSFSNCNSQEYIRLTSPIVQPSHKRQVQDTEKRLNILFDHINNEELLSADTLASMLRLAQGQSNLPPILDLLMLIDLLLSYGCPRLHHCPLHSFRSCHTQDRGMYKLDDGSKKID